jgi:hypothetical protein
MIGIAVGGHNHTKRKEDGVKGREGGRGGNCRIYFPV